MYTKLSIGLGSLRVLPKVILWKISTGHYYGTLLKRFIARKERQWAKRKALVNLK